MPADSPASAPFGEGLYTSEHIDQTYGEVLRRAQRHLRLGEPVIADASWTRVRHRGLAGDVARRTSSDLVELCCVAPSGVRAERLAARAAERADPSDADASIADAMASEADPWPSAVSIDTAPDVAVSMENARQAIERGLAEFERAGSPRR